MKKTLINLTSAFILVLLLVNGCKKDEDKPAGPLVSEGKEINFFKITNPAATGVIDTTNKTIMISVPTGTNLTNLVVDISLAAGHSITPGSGGTQNFTNPVVYTVKRPNNTTTTWTVTVSFSEINVTEDISQSTTWYANKTYIINEEINIGSNAVLTIEPGTVIKFGPSGSLAVGYYTNATLLANGTAAKPIIFTSTAAAPTAGAWEGIFFYDKTLSNTSLAYCNIMYAGSNQYYGAVNLDGCDIAINNCTISNSGSYGIDTYYTNAKGGFVTFDNNTITNTAKFGLTIHAQKLSTIGTGNTFTNIKGISVVGDYNSTTPQTWKNLNVPYIIAEEIDIDGNLTIAPGTTFKFESSGHFEIGYFSSTTFIAEGTATTPITFTSNAATPTAGTWEGLVFFGHTMNNSKMNYCIVEYAGTVASEGAVSLTSTCSFSFTNNIVRNCGAYGITVDAQAGFTAFNNNTITNCTNHVIKISTLHLPDLGTSNTLTAATGKGIEIYGDARYTNDAIWRKQTADFYVLDGEQDIDGMVSIEAGCKFLFNNNSFFWFGYYASTKVTAVGTATSRITFTSASSSPVAATWKGLYFDSYTQSNSAISYCDFRYSGFNGEPAIYTEVSFPVNNTNIYDFGTGHAAEYKTGITLPSGTGNNFTWSAN